MPRQASPLISHYLEHLKASLEDDLRFWTDHQASQGALDYCQQVAECVDHINDEED